MLFFRFLGLICSLKAPLLTCNGRNSARYPALSCEVHQGVQVCPLLVPQRHVCTPLRQLPKVHLAVHNARLFVCRNRAARKSLGRRRVRVRWYTSAPGKQRKAALAAPPGGFCCCLPTSKASLGNPERTSCSHAASDKLAVKRWQAGRTCGSQNFCKRPHCSGVAPCNVARPLAARGRTGQAVNGGGSHKHLRQQVGANHGRVNQRSCCTAHLCTRRAAISARDEQHPAPLNRCTPLQQGD